MPQPVAAPELVQALLHAAEPLTRLPRRGPDQLRRSASRTATIRASSGSTWGLNRSTTYGVTFPLTEKVEVNGPGRHPLYARFVEVPDERGRTGDIAWNFEKFVVDRSGRVVARFGPQVQPEDPRLVGVLEAALHG